MSRHPRFRWFVPFAIMGSVALLGCSGSSSSKGSSAKPPPSVRGVGASKLIAAAPDKTAAVRTARMAGKITVGTAGENRTIGIDGVLDLRNGAVQLSLDLGSLGLPLAGSGGTIEARLVDGVMYMNFGALAEAGNANNPLASQLAGKPWLKVDPSALGGSLGGESGGLDNLSSANPAGTLDGLRGAGDVRTIGTDDVRGVATTHYRVTIDPAKALDQAPPALRDKVRASLEQFPGVIPADVWIDGDGRLRKMSLDIDGTRGHVSEEFELYDFGAEVDVTAPPADQVTDFGSLFGGMLDGLRSGLESIPSGSA